MEETGPAAGPPEEEWYCDYPGCDQKGRAMGGLAAIPLFEWWPIKVSPRSRVE